MTDKLFSSQVFELFVICLVCPAPSHADHHWTRHISPRGKSTVVIAIIVEMNISAFSGRLSEWPTIIHGICGLGSVLQKVIFLRKCTQKGIFLRKCTQKVMFLRKCTQKVIFLRKMYKIQMKRHFM